MTTGKNHVYCHKMGSYEFLDHTADVLVRAWGETIEEAFEAAAEALFAVLTDSAPINPENDLTGEVQSIDQEGLLVTFLSELVEIFETQNVVLTDFEVAFHGDDRLSYRAKSEPFNMSKHGNGTQVKGVAYHLMEIAGPSRDQPAHVQVLLDI